MGNYLPYCLSGHFSFHILLQYHQHRIVTSNSSQEVRTTGIIYVVGHHTGMPGWSMHHHQVAREDHTPTPFILLLTCHNRREHALSGQSIHAVAVSSAYLTNTQLLQVTTQRSLCARKAGFVQFNLQIFLTFKRLRTDNQPDGLQTGLFILSFLHILLKFRVQRYNIFLE